MADEPRPPRSRDLVVRELRLLLHARDYWRHPLVRGPNCNAVRVLAAAIAERRRELAEIGIKCHEVS